MPNTKYDLESVDLPRLSGTTLRLFVNLLESPLTRGQLVRQLFRSAGIDRFRDLRLDDVFTYTARPPGMKPELQTVAQPLKSLPAHPQDRQGGLPYDTAQDYQRAYLTGEITPEEVAESVLGAIAASDRGEAPLRAFIAVNREDLVDQATASAKRYARGEQLGPLDGVPVAIKDEMDLRGYPTTVGTRFLGQGVAQDDAASVACLREAGALLVGKTNMHEIGIGVTGQNPHHGTVRNPYHPGRHTGGSSSGPAAAVAAGFCPLALGADGGGSIRIPASFCGVVGLKPTYGRISGVGSYPLDWSVGHLGPIGATAHDVALGYLVMSRPDPRDSRTVDQPPATVQGFEDFDLKDVTIGVYWPWFNHASPDMVQGCKGMLESFESLGARLQEIEIPELEPARVAHAVTIGSEIANVMEPFYEEHREDFSLEIRINLALARSFHSTDYLKAQQVRTRTIGHFQQVLRQVDVIATPAVGLTAPPIRPDALDTGDSDLSLLTEIMRFVTPVNLTGHPAIAFPVGYDADGLPVGLQLIGRYWGEDLLLRLAHAAEGFVERQTPRVFYKIL